MPAPEGKISQAQFLQNLKARNPELTRFPDNAIMARVYAANPDVREKIYTPDDAAVDEQNRLRGSAQKDTAFIRSVLNALPGAGAVIGGALSTPETLGAGTIPGIALGGGAGQGLKDISEQMLGLEDTTPIQKALNIGKETAFTGATAAIMPGVVEAAMHPVESSRVAAGMAAKVPSAFTPRWMKRWGVNLAGPLEDWATSGTPKVDPHVRPSWQVPPGFPEEPAGPIPGPTTTGFEGPPPSGPTNWTVNQPSRAPRPSGSTRTPWGSNVPISDEPIPFSARGSTSVPNEPPVQSGTTVKPDMTGKLDVTGKIRPIIQIDSNSGAMRGSTDGGKTWKYTVDNGKTWTEE